MTTLKLNRLIRELSQEQIAAAAELTQSTYSRIERQLRPSKPDERRRISRVLGVDAAVIFGESDTDASEACRS